MAGQFEQFEHTLIAGSGLAKDALHIHIGLLIFVVALLVWRGRWRWWVAWLAALAAAIGGEALDVAAEWSHSSIQPDSAHWHDVWNTMMWPTVLLAVRRWWPAGAVRPARSDQDGA